MTDGYTGAPDTRSLLTAARTALGAGQARLAIHLYCAAFEMGSQQGNEIQDELVEGMRVALNLACEIGDRSTAESLLRDLEPFSSQEQAASDRQRLLAMGPSPAEAMVIEAEAEDGPSEAEGLAQILSDATDGLDFGQWIRAFRSALGLPTDGDEDEAGAEGQESPGTGLLALPPGVGALSARGGQPGAEGRGGPPDSQGPPGSSGGPGLAGLSGFPGFAGFGGPQGLVDIRGQSLDRRGRGERGERRWRLDYNHIIGYRRAMEQMRRFGFFRRDEEDLHRFAERVAGLHGVPRLSLSEPFLFSGPDFSDVNFFAHATANEIGWPVLVIRVDVDERGNGYIKINGPVRQRFLGGPPDLNDLQTPCTVLVEDIGALQQIFEAERRNEGREGYGGPGGFGGGGFGGGGSPFDGGYRRSVRIEFGGYLRELINRPGIFFIATCRDDYQLDESMLDITGPMQRIEVDYPMPDERRDIWERLKTDHASMRDLDTERLVELSRDMPRTMLYSATQEAVAEAYRSSLESGQYQPVRMVDFLACMGSMLDQESEAYERLEDAAAAEFLDGFEAAF